MFFKDFLSNPKNINSFLIQWIEDQDKTENNSASISKKSSPQETLVQIHINNANSYEEFNEALNSSNDVEFLKQQRSKILTEIVQATTFDHLNKSKENTTTTTTTVSWLQIEKKIKGKIFIVICSIFSLILI